MCLWGKQRQDTKTQNPSKKKIINFGKIKISSLTDTVKKMKRQAKDPEKISATHTSDKRVFHNT